MEVTAFENKSTSTEFGGSAHALKANAELRQLQFHTRSSRTPLNRSMVKLSKQSALHSIMPKRLKRRHFKRTVRISHTARENVLYIHNLKIELLTMCEELKSTIAQYVEKSERCRVKDFLQYCLAKCDRNIYYVEQSLYEDLHDPRIKHVLIQKRKDDLLKELLDVELDLYHAELSVMECPDSILSRIQSLKDVLLNDMF